MNMPAKTDLSKVNKVFGQRVKAARLKKDWLQSDLAEALGHLLEKPVNTSTVNRIENGARPTPVQEVYALSEALRVSVHDLMPPEDALMTAVLPVFNAVNSIRDDIEKTESELNRLRHREATLQQAIGGYWKLKGVSLGQYKNIPEKSFREGVATLYDALTAEASLDHGVYIADAIGLEHNQIAKIAAQVGDNWDHEAIKKTLIEFLVEHFRDQINASS